MIQILSGYHIFMMSTLVLFVALATILHMQFGLTGITNFGLSGIYGFGMYACALLVVKLGMPFIPAVILATILTGLISLALGGLILDLDSQSILVGTLSFLVIVETLIVHEKWLTNGVLGLGPVNLPFDVGGLTKFLYFLILLTLTLLLMYYAWKLEASPPGRLLLGIQDNEPLANSLGKRTFAHKLVFFMITSSAAGFFGAMAVPIYTFLFPNYLGPAITFTLWIALMLGSRKKVLGGFIGVMVTVGLFDVLLESVVPIPPNFAEVLYKFKYFLYGLILILVLMFRPSGVLGEKRRDKGMEG